MTVHDGSPPPPFFKMNKTVHIAGDFSPTQLTGMKVKMPVLNPATPVVRAAVVGIALSVDERARCDACKFIAIKKNKFLTKM